MSTTRFVRLKRLCETFVERLSDIKNWVGLANDHVHGKKSFDINLLHLRFFLVAFFKYSLFLFHRCYTKLNYKKSSVKNSHNLTKRRTPVYLKGVLQLLFKNYDG